MSLSSLSKEDILIASSVPQTCSIASSCVTHSTTFSSEIISCNQVHLKLGKNKKIGTKLCCKCKEECKVTSCKDPTNDNTCQNVLDRYSHQKLHLIGSLPRSHPVSESVVERLLATKFYQEQGAIFVPFVFVKSLYKMLTYIRTI